MELLIGLNLSKGGDFFKLLLIMQNEFKLLNKYLKTIFFKTPYGQMFFTV